MAGAGEPAGRGEQGAAGCPTPPSTLRPTAPGVPCGLSDHWLGAGHACARGSRQTAVPRPPARRGPKQTPRSCPPTPTPALTLLFGHLDRLTPLNSDFCQVLIKRFQPSGPRAWVPFPLTGKYTFLWRRGVQVEEAASPDPAGPGGHSLLLEGALPCPEGPSCALAHLVPDPHAARGAARRWPRRLLQWA